MKLKILLHDGKPLCCLAAETAGEASALAVMARRVGWENAPPVEKISSMDIYVDNLFAQCKPVAVVTIGPDGTDVGNDGSKPGNKTGSGAGSYGGEPGNNGEMKH